MNESSTSRNLPVHVPRTEQKSQDSTFSPSISWAQRLFEYLLSRGVQPWKGTDGNPYVRIMSMESQPDFPVRNKQVRALIQTGAYQHFKRVFTKASVDQVLDHLEALALSGVHEHPVSRRVGYHGDSIYLDTVRKDGSVIKIDSSGYRIIPRVDAPVRLIRFNGMKELPLPSDPKSSSGALKEAATLLGLLEHIAALVIAFLVSGLNPAQIYLILILQGGQGSGKSSLARFIKLLIDPHEYPIGPMMRSERDLAIAASHSHVLVIDNLSGLPQQMSDAICRLSTGGGLRLRQLYTDSEEVYFKLANPVILNGIDEIASRNDLADRAIIVRLPPISPSSRKSESRLNAELDKLHPRILGELCSMLSRALRDRNTVTLTRKPRMLDVALWLKAAQSALDPPVDLVKHYLANIDEVAAFSVEHDPVASAIHSMILEKGHWKGSASELQDYLRCNNYLRTTGTISDRGFAEQVWRAESALGRVGIRLTYDPKRKDAKTRRTIYEITSVDTIAFP